MMKLVIGGSTGYVGSELVRQALTEPAVTCVIALGRRETPTPDGVGNDAKKLKSVICEDFEHYSDEVKKELADSDACVWTIALTPQKLKGLPLEEVNKINCGYAITAVKTLRGLRKGKEQPLRFIYMSAHFAPRRIEDAAPILTATGLLESTLARGKTEVEILEMAAGSGGALEACICKPGFIEGPDKANPNVPGLPAIHIREISAAMIREVVNGFEKDTLSNDDLLRIGQKALGE